MNPKITNVQANEDFTLTIQFENEEVRIFDVKPYLNIGIFKELKEYHKFRKVKPFLGSIQWIGGQDLCPDTLYIESKPVERMEMKTS